MPTSTLTDEQKALRIGRFAGSELHKLMGIKGFGKTGETYIYEKVAEKLTGQPNKEEFTAASTQWGIDHELEAQLYFEAATGSRVKAGTTLDNGHIIGTPDGIAESKEWGFEIKCPYNSGNHLKNLGMQNAADLLDLRTEYYWQCVSYMWLTGLNKWKFCSYDPRFQKPEQKMLILNIELFPAHLELLKNRVTEAKLMFDNIISKLA
ncbi:MAG TPA: hypothetical protein DF296_13615 [Candidatus Margulisbacteria bacterium]|nr:hypothetical protein [Candidatus Margulisiibacteriota bacterium]